MDAGPDIGVPIESPRPRGCCDAPVDAVMPPTDAAMPPWGKTPRAPVDAGVPHPAKVKTLKVRLISTWSEQGVVNADVCTRGVDADSFRGPWLAANNAPGLRASAGLSRIPIDVPETGPFTVRWVSAGDDCAVPLAGTADTTIENPEASTAERQSWVLANPGLDNLTGRRCRLLTRSMRRPTEVVFTRGFYTRASWVWPTWDWLVSVKRLHSDRYSLARSDSRQRRRFSVPILMSAPSAGGGPFRALLSVCAVDANNTSLEVVDKFASNLLGGDVVTAYLTGARDNPTKPIHFLLCSDRTSDDGLPCRRVDVAPSAALNITPDQATEEPTVNITFELSLDRQPSATGVTVYVRGNRPQSLTQLNLFGLSVEGEADFPVPDLDSSGFTILMKSQTVKLTLPTFQDGVAEEPVTVTYGLVPYLAAPWGTLDLPEPLGSYEIATGSGTAQLTFRDE